MIRSNSDTELGVSKSPRIPRKSLIKSKEWQAKSQSTQQIKPQVKQQDIDIDAEIDKLLITDSDHIQYMIDTHIQSISDGATDPELARSMIFAYETITYSKKHNLTLNLPTQTMSGICRGCVSDNKITQSSAKFYPMLYQSCVDCHLADINQELEGDNPVVLFNLSRNTIGQPVLKKRINIRWNTETITLYTSNNGESVDIYKSELKYVRNHLPACMFAQIGIPEIYFQELGITENEIIVNKKENILCRTAFLTGNRCKPGIAYNLPGTRYVESDAPFTLSDKCSYCLDVTTGFYPTDIPPEFRADRGTPNYISSIRISAKREKISKLIDAVPTEVYDLSVHQVTDKDYSDFF